MAIKIIAGKEIEIHELTVGQVDALLGDLEKAAPLHMCDLLFPERMPFSIVCMVTGQKESFFNDLLPSDYAAVLEAAEEANPYSMAAVKRLAEIGRTLLPDLPRTDSQK